MSNLTIEELVRQVITAVKTVDINQNESIVLANINALINELRGGGISGKSFKDYSADELSRVAGSLALLKDYLGEILAKVQSYARYSEWQVDFRKARIRKPIIEKLLHEEEAKKVENKAYKKFTNDDIEAELEEQTAREKQVYLFREQQYNEALNKWRSINSILDMIEQRVRILASNRADVKFQDDSLDLGANKIEKLRTNEEIKKDAPKADDIIKKN